ncbi:NAD(P)(+) transhydrogenase (Re/Si-specific) subunit beta, partial [Chitinimonas sp.]|uniref:NAD(P)(+) transhydrogenase (Re/Si-specific) subunit beta n=1 Tax=Chitinimonas sp. TaxID=1934313 RepID=UPI0035B447CC
MSHIAQYADWIYLVAAILFILTLKGLSSPTGAIAGNRYGMVGMGLAVLVTLVLAPSPNLVMIVVAMMAGALVGTWRAKTVPMTQMPETVAMMHSLVGLAAVLIALASVHNPIQHHSTVQRVELFVGCFIGGITFTASIIAWGKLSAKLAAKPLK